MKIAVIQATSQKGKNALLFETARRVCGPLGHEVVNFGVFGDEDYDCSYVETALDISLLLSSGAADFALTGCSSGQGMMLALNSLPGVLCGYTPTPQDAYLFGRINDGNAVSLPLGLGYGWCGEVALAAIVEKLFQDPFGTGYPAGDAARKMRDTHRLKAANAVVKRSFLEAADRLDPDLVAAALRRECVCRYVLENGKDPAVVDWLRARYK